MKDEVKDILENSMKDIVLDAIKKVDIESIMKSEIESTVKGLARDMFREYGDFGKELKEKLSKEISFNIDAISVPNFGRIAIDTVSAELTKFEHEEADKIRIATENRLKEFLGKHDEKVTLETIEDLFGRFIYDEFLKDDCSCEMQDFDADRFSNVQEYLEYTNGYDEIKLTIHERETTYSSMSNSVITHLKLEYDGKDHTNTFDDKSKDRYSLSIHIHRKENDGEKWQDKSDWKNDKDNFYSILSMEINGRSVEADGGTIILSRLNEPHEQLLASIFVGDRLLDASKLSHFELERE